MDKHGKDSWHDLIAMPRAGRDVRGNICATGGRKRLNVSGVPVDAGGVTRLRSGGDSRIAPDKISDPA